MPVPRRGFANSAQVGATIMAILLLMATILFQLSSLAFAPALPRLSPALPAIHTRAAPINLLVDVPTAGAVLDHTAQLTAFADQGNNLAGIFFQASLPSYLIFLYFLGYEKNRTPKVAMFGFQFLLLFVLSTVFTGIVTKSVYSSSLADVDWLHGAAEALLTTSNLYVGLGFRAALAGDAPPAEGDGSFRYPAFAIFACVVLATALGPGVLNFAQHDAFLAGIGNLDANPLAGLGLSLRDEPVNALDPDVGDPLLLGLRMALCYGLRHAVRGRHGQQPVEMAHVWDAAAPCVGRCRVHLPLLLQLRRRQVPRRAQAGLTLFGQYNRRDRRPAHRALKRLDDQRDPRRRDANLQQSQPVQRRAGGGARACGGGAAAVGDAGRPPGPAPRGGAHPRDRRLLVWPQIPRAGARPAYDPSAIVGWLICLTIPAAVGYNFASKPDPPPPKPA